MNSLTRIIIAFLLVAAVFFAYHFIRKPTMIYAFTNVKTSEDAIALFPTTISQIRSRTQAVLEQAKHDLEKIIAIPDDQRNFANTAHALDQLVAFSNMSINAGAIATLDLVSPDEKIRDAARAAVLETQNFLIDNIATNRELYRAFKTYADTNAKNEALSTEQKYFVDETVKDFERSGLNLPEEQLQEVKKIKKELANLELEFDKNIGQDQSKIEVDESGLSGLSESFIKSLKKTADGKYILGVDYPTYTQVMENCMHGQTRKDLWNAFANRAYPVNKKILEDIILKRAQLATLLGFKSYAALELDSEMVHTPQRAISFLDQIKNKASKKAIAELKAFTKKLPDSVILAKDKKLYPWDVTFVKNQYKKSALKLDENKVAEYFPMQHTVDSLLKIYQDFFNLEFKQTTPAGLWDADVRMIEVFDKSSGITAGYLFLDLFPRANKYSHACEHTIIPVIYDREGNPNPGVAIVIANFPKPTADKPSLMHFKDVTTFFHEFGHAMHALLGRTNLASFAGTSVKRDFVEMPSQMLEEWMWTPEILKLVSSHYQTGQSLPEDIIKTIIKARTYDTGLIVMRQLMLANLSLAYFNDPVPVDLDAKYKMLFNIFMNGIQYQADDHFYTSFGHLTGYGARYYGYMWSSVFAHDLFYEIKKGGLLNPEIGRKYINAVIGKGGSKDPNDLLKDFLGREPNQKAFLHDMGFE